MEDNSDIQTEIIPVISEGMSEQIDDLNTYNLSEGVEVLPLRKNILFPGVISHITVGRKTSLESVKKAYENKSLIGVLMQKNSKDNNPIIKDMYHIGVLVIIIKLINMPNGKVMAILQAKRRFLIKKIIQDKLPFVLVPEVLLEKEDYPSDDEKYLLKETLKETALKLLKVEGSSPESILAVKNIDSAIYLSNFIASNILLDKNQKQSLLEMDSHMQRSNKVLEFLLKDLAFIELKQELQQKVKGDLDQQQKEFFLHQQMKQIQTELGNKGNEDVEVFLKKSAKKKWSKHISKVFNRELDRFSKMNPQSAEYFVNFNYLDFFINLPWNKKSKDTFNIVKAEKVLNKAHYGLEDVKERILEFLSVLQLTKHISKAPILCLYGPPGVGKTSLGKSIAKALNRKFGRISLGGVSDESEIRGHRRTYIGAMPGRILKQIEKVGVSNPVIILDEIDKIGKGYQGNPQSALLEVLDPEQNKTFSDNFLEQPYDLSSVLFIATANDLSTIHPALRDRMEIINLSGYILQEKREIVKKFILPEVFKENGLQKHQLELSERLIDKVIQSYTVESGVRQLKQKIAKIVRYRVKQIVKKEVFEKEVKIKELSKILGKKSNQLLYKIPTTPGIIPGLAWSPVGGSVLYIETGVSKGKGNLSLTGSLGDVMKESATIALKYLKIFAQKYGINEDLFKKVDFHIHVPEGATPKDGPSAGVTMFTALLSLFTEKRIRPYTAMTGEITLRGEILAVGGIKEKILAAKQFGINRVLLPSFNEQDVMLIPNHYLKNLEIVYVNNLEELTIALELEKEKTHLGVPLDSYLVNN